MAPLPSREGPGRGKMEIMRTSISPVIATLLFAAAAAALVASAAALPYPAPRVSRVNAALSLALAGYAVYLARLHRRPISVLFGPILVAAAAALAAGSVSGFALPAAAALAWVRSGICSGTCRGRRWALEVIAGAGGLVLAEMIYRLAPGPRPGDRRMGVRAGAGGGCRLRRRCGRSARQPCALRPLRPDASARGCPPPGRKTGEGLRGTRFVIGRLL